MTDFHLAAVRLVASGVLALAQLSAPANAEDSFTSSLDSVVRAICMNDAMRFDERFKTLSTLGWEPAGDMGVFQLFADLEARAYLLGRPDTATQDLTVELAEAAETFQKMIARRLGEPAESLDRLVFLESRSLPGLTLELVKFPAGDQMTVDICKFASASPPPEFVQYVERIFDLTPAKEITLGRHRIMFFRVNSKVEKTWTLEITENLQADGEAISMLLSINTRVRKE